MRHGVKRIKLNRNMGERKALVRSLAVALFTNERIVTTHAKAKVVKPFADHLLARAKNDTVATRRLLLTKLPNNTIVEKLLKDLAPRYTDRTSGFSRIISLGKRKSDAAQMARIELIDMTNALPTGKKKPKTKEVSQQIAVERTQTVAAADDKGTRQISRGKVTGPERLTRSKPEKMVARRQVSIRREGKK